MFSSIVREAHTAFLKSDYISCIHICVCHLFEHDPKPSIPLTQADKTILAAVNVGCYQCAVNDTAIQDEDLLMEIKRLLQLAIYESEPAELEKGSDIQSALDNFQKKHDEDTERLRKQVLPEVADIIESVRAVSIEGTTSNVSPKKPLAKKLAESKFVLKADEGGKTGGIVWTVWNHEIRKQLLDVQIPIDHIAAGENSIADWAQQWREENAMGKLLLKLKLDGEPPVFPYGEQTGDKTSG